MWSARTRTPEKAVYHNCLKGDAEDIQWMRASASMPALSRFVKLDSYSLSDGGTADSIPVRFFESIGYDRNVVILTQPEGYVKKPNQRSPSSGSFSGKIRLSSMPSRTATSATTRPSPTSENRNALETSWSSAPKLLSTLAPSNATLRNWNGCIRLEGKKGKNG